MTLAPKRLCRCGYAHREKRCPRCVQATDQARGTARARGYDAVWERIRMAKLQAHPWCQCDDCLQARASVLATDVDHKDGNPRNNAWSNLRSMAHGHHSRRTAIDQSGWGRR